MVITDYWDNPVLLGKEPITNQHLAILLVYSTHGLSEYCRSIDSLYLKTTYSLEVDDCQNRLKGLLIK